MTLPGCETQDSDDETIDAEEDRKNEEATKQRKKAGLPQITVDTLPSTVATKMMTLGFTTAEFHLRFVHFWS